MNKKILEIKFKKLNKEAILPTKATPTDAGLDLYAIKRKKIASNNVVAIETGIAMELPIGYYAQIFERSGYSLNNTLKIKAGVVDNGYRGEIKVIMQNCGDYPVEILPKTKIAQIVLLPVPEIEVLEVEELSDTTRGEKGFGSSDNQPK